MEHFSFLIFLRLILKNLKMENWSSIYDGGLLSLFCAASWNPVSVEPAKATSITFRAPWPMQVVSYSMPKNITTMNSNPCMPFDKVKSCINQKLHFKGRAILWLGIVNTCKPCWLYNTNEKLLKFIGNLHFRILSCTGIYMSLTPPPPFLPSPLPVVAL